MIYEIRHITRFDYGANVKFARCNLRLKPIHWSGQDLLDYQLTISPSGRKAHPLSTRDNRRRSGLVREWNGAKCEAFVALRRRVSAKRRLGRHS